MDISAVRYLPVLLIIGSFLIFIWKKWDFFKGVLSDGVPVMDAKGDVVRDKEGNPIILGSTTRVLAFLFGLAIILAFLYATIQTQKLDTTHLELMLLSIAVLVGAVKIIDALSIIKGQKPPQND
jgi:hypothetical protein